MKKTRKNAREGAGRTKVRRTAGSAARMATGQWARARGRGRRRRRAGQGDGDDGDGPGRRASG